MKRRHFLQASLSFTLGTPLLAAVRVNRFQDAARVLEAATDSGQVRAASLFVRSKSEVFSRSFGDAKPDDAFLLGSISKPISIVALMTLFDAGEFRLNDPVKKFLPEFHEGPRKDITIQQLLTHVSGLPDQLPENAKLRAAHAPLSEFVAGAIRTPLLFAPGTRYSYSSMAILLASAIAERISGRPIADLIQETVCKPLQLNRTALGASHLAGKPALLCQVENAAPESGAGDASAKTWDWNSGYWRKLGAPWGGAFASAADVGKFLDAFLHPEGNILKPDTAQLMITNHNPPTMRPRGLSFDLGERLGGPSRRTVFGHTGSTGTVCWADRQSDSVCVVLTTLPARAVSPHPRDIVSRRVAAAIK